jgi:hypothetical protein
MSRQMSFGILLSTAILAAPSSRAQGPSKRGSDPRLELAAFGEQLDAAVAKVSQPSPMQVLGPMTASRGYMLPGYGAVFVVPARSLPGDKRVIVMRAPRARGTMRIDIPVMPPVSDADLERQIQAMEFQVEALSRAAERESREAEQALERFAQEVRVRYPEAAPPPASSVEVPTPPAAPAAPSAPVAAPAAPAGIAPVAPAPWRFWFQGEEQDDPRPAERIVGDVRAAVTQALEARGFSLRVVQPDEFLAVVVDFTARGFPFRGERSTERTLVVRARKRDLDERQGGRLGADELKKRIDYVEY